MKKKNYRTLLCRLSGILSLTIWFMLSSAGCKSRPEFPEGWRADSPQERSEYDPLVQEKLDEALRQFFNNPAFDDINEGIPKANSE